MILKSAPIKGNPGNTSRLGTLCNQTTYGFCCFSVTRFPGAQAFVQRGCASQYMCAIISYDLRIDVSRRTVNCKAIHAQLTNLGTGTTRSAKTRLLLIAHILALLLLGFF